MVAYSAAGGDGGAIKSAVKRQLKLGASEKSLLQFELCPIYFPIFVVFFWWEVFMLLSQASLALFV